jgi:NarL family two-component system response regulator LiaR
MSNVNALLNVCRKYISNKPESVLTRRETEVSLLIAEGMTNKEIAKKLYLGEKTVKSHVSNILAKLNAANRVQAAVYIIKHDVTNLCKELED